MSTILPHPLYSLGGGQMSRERRMQQHGYSKYFVCKHILDPGGRDNRSKTFFLLKVVMLHIKLKGMERRTLSKQILCPYTYPRLLSSGEVKWSFFLFWKRSCFISNQREGSVDQHASKHFDLTCAPDLWGSVEKSDIEIVKICIFFY